MSSFATLRQTQFIYLPKRSVVEKLTHKSSSMKKQTKEILKNLKEAQTKISLKKERLETVFIDGQSGDGTVVVTITGNKEVVNIAIDDSILMNSKQLEEHLIAALNNAIDKATRNKEDEISKLRKEGYPYILNF